MTEQKKIYRINCLMPTSYQTSGWMTHFPKGWKTLKDDYHREFARIKKFSSTEKLEFRPSNQQIIADSLAKAKEKALQILHEEFDGMTDYDGRLYGEESEIVSPPFVNYEPPLRRRIADIHNSQVPLYALDGFNIKGVAISFQDIEAMIQRQELPRIFLQNPSLIPKEIFLRTSNSIYGLEKETDFIFDREVTPENAPKIARAFVNHEKDARHNLKDRNWFLKTTELFAEDIFFFVYKPEPYSNNGWAPHASKERFSAYSWAPMGYGGIKSQFVLKTKEEIADYLRKLTKRRVASHRKAIETSRIRSRGKNSKRQHPSLNTQLRTE